MSIIALEQYKPLSPLSDLRSNASREGVHRLSLRLVYTLSSEPSCPIFCQANIHATMSCFHTIFFDTPSFNETVDSKFLDPNEPLGDPSSPRESSSLKLSAIFGHLKR